MAEPTYIVYTPPLNLNSGGAIALHYLAQALAKRGERVRLWPMDVSVKKMASFLAQYRLGTSSRLAQETLRLGKLRATPEELGDDAIVVYPEFAYGNPLNARNVVRWLLNKPGRFKKFQYSIRDMFFKFSDYSDDPAITKGAQPLFLFYANPVYRDPGPVERSGSCYMVRKGVGKEIVHPRDSICLDKLPHEKVAQVFSHCETFYCYDEATMYSQYAALCGCTSVVMPEFYQSRAEWARARPVARYGVAFGLNDLDHARATRHLLPGHLRAMQEEGLRTVDNFIRTTRANFDFAAPVAPASVAQ